MSNETFLISLKQNNDLSTAAVNELRMDTEEHPLNQQKYIALASLAGNGRQYGVNQVKTKRTPLLNKRVLFLGSSVTLGYGALGESFVDYLWKADGVQAIKDAENGTTLTDNGENSYVERFNGNLDIKRPDAFVLQLSTNDAVQKMPLGVINSKGSIDVKTITGALEYIITTAQNKWHCPILVFSNPPFKNKLYQKMVTRMQVLANNYQIDFLDLYHHSDFQNQSSLYMADLIHPTRAGYFKKWLPVFEEKLQEMFA